MESLYADFDENVPRYVCTSCAKCSSLFGQSLCKVKNRGCCFYFPKFNLLNLQRMSKSSTGLSILNKILNNEGTEIFHYYIYAKGYFEKENYLRFINYQDLTEQEETVILQSHEFNVKDLTQFFRACPFVKEGVGCTIPPKFRATVCNFFICDEIKIYLTNKNLLNIYNSACENYSRWENWVNNSLILLLKNYNLNLKDNFNDCLHLLMETDLDEYEFPKLPDLLYELDKSYCSVAATKK